MKYYPCPSLFARYQNEPHTTILHAVNETWDNDTTASVVACAMGTLHGRIREINTNTIFTYGGNYVVLF